MTWPWADTVGTLGHRGTGVERGGRRGHGLWGQAPHALGPEAGLLESRKVASVMEDARHSTVVLVVPVCGMIGVPASGLACLQRGRNNSLCFACVRAYVCVAGIRVLCDRPRTRDSVKK